MGVQSAPKETGEPDASHKEDKTEEVKNGKEMHTRLADEPRGRLFAMEEKWKLIYNENNRSPTYSVSHYISYLRRYVSATGQLREIISGKTTERFSRKGLYDRAETRPSSKDTQRSLDSISPMSYFIRKLKLDLQMAFIGFVEEFVQPPSNGLRLLLLLLKNMQVLSMTSGDGLLTREGAKGTLKVEEYKRNMIDEQDCLLCIKYTLRVGKSVDELLDYNAGLLTVTSCVLSNFSRSRITSLEILTLLLAGPSAVDRVLDAFTSMRIIHAESCRFKMLVNMLYTRGVSHVLFQVSCLRLLNTLLNLCKSANMRVYLQYEIEEAGLDLARLQQHAAGDGLEYDDLKKEIWEYKMRYIDVDVLLRKMKADLKADAPGSAVTEFKYDQHFGRVYGSSNGNLDMVHVQHTANHEEPMYSRPGSKNIETMALRELHNNGGHFAPQSANIYVSGFVSSTPPTSNTSNNFTDGGMSGSESCNNNNNRRRNQDEPSRVEILSRTASPTNPRPTRALTDAKINDASKDFQSGGFTSVKTEFWEPYGLVIRPNPPSEVHPSEEEVGERRNWVLNSSNKHRPHRNRDALRNDFFSSSDDENEETNAKGINSNNDVNKNVSRLFYSPKNSGMDSGPLRWFNPGITVPPTPQDVRLASSGDKDNLVYKPAPYTGGSNKKPKTPPPDYKKLPTPPPDYNDSDPEDRLENRAFRIRKLSMSSGITDSTDYSKQSKQFRNVNPTFRPGVAPYGTSTMKSNFQRWPAVRRKSFSELSKPTSRSSSSPSPHQSETQSPPPLPPPRVIYSNANTTATTSQFFSGHIPEGTKTSNKHNSNKYVRHGESKSMSQDSSSAAVRERPVGDDHVQDTITANKAKASNNFHVNSFGKDSTADQQPVTVDSGSSGTRTDYSPAIPLNCFPKENQAGIQKSESFKNLFTESASPHPHREIVSVSVGRDKPVSKSTIIISSNHSSVIQNTQKSDAVDKNVTHSSNKGFKESAALVENSAVNNQISGTHENQLRDVSSSSKRSDDINNAGSAIRATQVTTAITITSPTPPTSLTAFNSGIFTKVRPQLPLKGGGNNKNSEPNTSHEISQNQIDQNHTQPDLDQNDVPDNIGNTSKLNCSNKGKATSELAKPLTGPAREEISKKPQEPLPVSAAHMREDSALSYTSEIGRVLGELDHTLETHGWQASLREQVRRPRPTLVAYV